MLHSVLLHMLCNFFFFHMLCIFIDNLQISMLLYNLPPPLLPFVSMPLVPSTDPLKLLVLAPLTHTLLNMLCDFITFVHLLQQFADLRAPVQPRPALLPPDVAVLTSSNRLSLRLLPPPHPLPPTASECLPAS